MSIDPKASRTSAVNASLDAFPHLHFSVPYGTEVRRIPTGDVAKPYFEVEATLNIGDPVHETITERALRSAGLIGDEQTFTTDEAWEYTRGVFWNDDPECLLFKDNDLPRNYSLLGGGEFLIAFKETADSAKQPGVSFGRASRLLARSHFGDLQFLHSMATKDGEDPKQTRAWILEWAEFMYAVATQPALASMRVGDVPLPQVRRWFPSEPRTVSSLFGIFQVGNVQHRAIASLLHLVQDSYAAGHAARHHEDRRILEFHSYIHQDSSRHAAGDKFQNGRLEETPGALQAVSSCAAILGMYQRRDSWQNLMVLLRDGIFELTDFPRLSSAGADFSAG